MIWQDWQIETLRKLFGTYSRIELAKTFNTTKGCIAYALYKYDIKKVGSKIVMPSYRRQREVYKKKPTRTKWNDGEVRERDSGLYKTLFIKKNGKRVAYNRHVAEILGVAFNKNMTAKYLDGDCYNLNKDNVVFVRKVDKLNCLTKEDRAKKISIGVKHWYRKNKIKNEIAANNRD